jgi:hypothetical protein
MMIETTISIHSTILEKINHAALLMDISRSQIIIQLIKKEMNNAQNHTIQGKRIQYQDRDCRKNWHTFHLQIRPDDYEYFLDLRKLFKMSVSRILAIAVGKYLKKNMKKMITDNYLYKNYMIIKEVIDDVICWKLLWGFPKNPKKLFTRH